MTETKEKCGWCLKHRKKSEEFKFYKEKMGLSYYRSKHMVRQKTLNSNGSDTFYSHSCTVCKNGCSCHSWGSLEVELKRRTCR